MGLPWLFVLLKININYQNLIKGHYEGYTKTIYLQGGVKQE